MRAIQRPRDRLILDLIDADPASSILIGRPCYYGIKAGCEPSNWTTARYSSEVVAHLSEAVNQIVQRFPKSEIVIIGYSGGGTLAMLAAPNIARVDTLVSVAANLDTEAWVDHHGYAPLVGSLNPADQPPLSPAIQQFHFFGENRRQRPGCAGAARYRTPEECQDRSGGGFWPPLLLVRNLDSSDREDRSSSGGGDLKPESDSCFYCMYV